MQKRKITFEQLYRISKLVRLEDCDGHEFKPCLDAADETTHGTADYAPTDEGYFLFTKAEDPRDDLVIHLREDGVTLPNMDVDDEDLVLYFKFPAEYVIGWDPSNKLPTKGDTVRVRYEDSTGHGDLLTGSRQSDGWYTGDVGPMQGPPLRWYPIWEIELTRALDGV